MFDDKFFLELPTEPDQAAYKMCEYFTNFDIRCETPDEEVARYKDYVEAYAALEAFIKATGLPFDSPKLGSDRIANVSTIRSFFKTVFSELDARVVDWTLIQAQDKYRMRFGGVFHYEFSDGDISRIQVLVNELRNLISQSKLFDAKHKERILAKFEALQKELYKKVSSLDKFWGLIGDAGVVLGKFGNDAKPFVDRIQEIAQIVWRTQARAEELPSGFSLPLLSTNQHCDQLEQPRQQSDSSSL